MISLEKWMILKWFLQKLPNNVGNLGKLIVATGFEWLPKVQKIALSGHTDYEWKPIGIALSFVDQTAERVLKILIKKCFTVLLTKLSKKIFILISFNKVSSNLAN